MQELKVILLQEVKYNSLGGVSLNQEQNTFTDSLEFQVLPIIIEVKAQSQRTLAGGNCNPLCPSAILVPSQNNKW